MHYFSCIKMSLSTDVIFSDVVGQFSLDNLTLLLDRVEEQIRDYSCYNLRNNVAILRLFLLYPDVSNAVAYEKILALSLGQVSAPDFTIALAMIPLSVQSNPRVAKVIKLGTLLQKCNFSKFWSEANVDLGACKLLDVPGFKANIRKFVMELLPLVYMHISLPQLRVLLHYDSNCEEMRQLLVNNGWILNGFEESEETGGTATCKAMLNEAAKIQKPTTQQKYFRADALKSFQNSMRASC